MEEFKVKGDKLKDKLKEIVREGNVRRIIVRNHQGRTLIDFPLSAGIVGAALLPLWAAIGGIVALAADFTIAVERDPDAVVVKKE